MKKISLRMTSSALAIQAAMAASTVMLSAVPASAFTESARNTLTFSNALNSATINATSGGVSVALSVSHTAVGGATITLSLPTGLNFAFAPVVACAGTNLTSSGFSAGNTTAVFTTGGVSACGTGAGISVTSVYLGGANTFASGGGTNATISFSSSLPGETATLAANLSLNSIASFAAPVTLGSTTSTGGATIDISLGGSRFASGTTGTTALTLGNVSFTTAGRLDVDGATNVSFSLTGGTVTISTLTGSFTGLSSVYATTAASCATVAPTGAVSVTTTAGSTITSIAGLAGTTGTTYNVCAIAAGTTVLPTSTFRLSLGGTLVNGAAATAVNSTTGNGNNALTTYNGGANQLNYYVGAGALYNSYINVTNTGASTGQVFLVGTTRAGATVSGLLDSALTAGASKLYTPAQVGAILGTTSFTESSPGRVNVLVTPSGIAQNLVVNPGNVVVPLN